MPDSSFGARLRQHREERQIALSTIAEQTKIKRSLLEALERDDLSHWPSGIFRRSWFRSYANAIGVDADAALREFASLHPDPEEPAINPQEGASPAPPQGLRGILGTAAKSLSRLRRPAAPADAGETPPAAQTESSPSPGASLPPDLPAIARLVTSLGHVAAAAEVPPLLREAARLLDASGLIVWVWDRRASALKPALVHGYSPTLVARLPQVTRDADNPTAAAFRSGEPRVVYSTDEGAAALVMPLLIPPQCAGVLAIELRQGSELTDTTRSVAEIVAASIAQLVARARATQARARLGSARLTQQPAKEAPKGTPVSAEKTVTT